MKAHMIKPDDSHPAASGAAANGPPSSSDAHLRELALSSQDVFTGNFLHVRRDQVRLPNGGKATREYIVHPGAVVVIALVDRGDSLRMAPELEPVTVNTRSVLMERQFRYPVGCVISEFPAGKRDPGESGLACAQRELLEETGFVATSWALAGNLMPAVAYADEVIEIWFAKGLHQRGRRLDAEEFLDVELVSVEALGEWCRQGQLPDAKSVTCLWWLEQWCAGKLALSWVPDLV